MSKVLQYLFLPGIALTLQFISFFSTAQERCGTVEYSRSIHADYQKEKIVFENWLRDILMRQQTGRTKRPLAPPYKIPVVVHVVHNGQAIGVGPNIPDAQILSQIKVLNDDFRRTNADAVNTPASFAAVAGGLDVEFILARQDPDGLSTDGIVRVNGGRAAWTMNDNYALKETSYWPAEEYLNIWVCNLDDEYVGYAQFPESDLEGLEDKQSTNRLTDGIVVHHRAFGSIDDGNFALDANFDKGRTLTHEAGHFFGLLHIWGDNNVCTDTDFVADTPNQGGNTDGCPSHPQTDNCGQQIMFQNFLDYTNDACMNLFTQGQLTRMMAVIENSPRRNTLLTSPGLEDPLPLANDIGIRTVLFPDATVCNNEILPQIELRNYGINSITSTQIMLTIDGVVQETKNFALALDPTQSANVTFTQVSLSSGEHEFTFEVQSTNGGTDGSSHNDLQAVSAIVPSVIQPPFTENFNTTPSGWIIQNPDGQITWEIVTAPRDVPANKALKLNYFDYEDKIGEIDTYLSPVIDLSTAPAALLSFDVSHARFQSSNDRLKVIGLTNCEPLSNGTVLYNKGGDTLKTAPPTSATFTPSGPAQWRREIIDLSQFVGQDKIQIAFVGINDWGNNIYIDNITFITEQSLDVSLLGLADPTLITCHEVLAPQLRIQNTGTIELENLILEYTVNGGTSGSIPVTDLNLLMGEQKQIALPEITLQQGINTLSVALKDPNGLTDENPTDNQNEFTIVLNQSEERVPLRENFDGDFTQSWTIINPTGGMDWQLAATNFNQSLSFDAFNNPVIGDQAWLISPVLDFSQTAQASMVFDLSYKAGSTGKETLRILASTDCGNTFFEVAYNFPVPAIATDEWVPQTEEDWNRNVIVNLTSLVGIANARIAFVADNQNGNNLYIDNIEFFTTSDPDFIEIAEIYSIYGYDLAEPVQSNLKVTFNLSEKHDVQYTVVNMLGQIEADGVLRDVLNQTYPLTHTARLAPGMYIIRLRIGDRYYASRILIGG